MNLDPIQSTVQSLQQIYTIVLALSLGEAFKQFVADTKTGVSETNIQWDRLLNLATFLLLIFPFFHGMNRYLFDVYIVKHDPTYSLKLLRDCIAFTLEGGLFFVLSRSLPQNEWHRFYETVAALLLVDVVWGGMVWLNEPGIGWWVTVNLITVPLVLLTRIKFDKGSWWGTAICMLLVLARTILDYALSWKIYFPPAAGG